MIEFQNFTSPALIILAVIFAGLSFFVYRHTNPPIPGYLRKTLAALRTLTFLIILFALFNSVFSIIYFSPEERYRYFFIDNSASIPVKDSITRREKISRFIAEYSKDQKNRFFLFGSAIEPYSGNNFTMGEKLTNFGAIENFITDRLKDASAAVIVSDGIITEGVNPLFGFEKSGLPFYTVGIGDTSSASDIELTEPVYSTPLYRGAETFIEAQILNSNLAGKNVSVRLFEDGKLFSQKNLILGAGGADNIRLPYKPSAAGEKRITLSVSPLPAENNKENNSRTFPVQVINDKIKVLMIAGTPSADFSAVADILRKEERIKFHSIAELGGGKEIKRGGVFPIDSADVFFLFDYPSSNAQRERLEQITAQLLVGKKPLLYFLSGSGAGVNRNEISPALPFSTGRYEMGTFSAAAYAAEPAHPILDKIDSPLLELLPPLSISKSKINPAEGSLTLIKAKGNNDNESVPVLIVSEEGGRKSASFIGADFWRWKLQNNLRLEGIAEKLIFNSLLWLNAPAGKKNFTLITSRKIFYLGEKIEISARVFDELYNPVETAEVKLKITGSGTQFDMPLINSGGGIYKGEIETARAGTLSILASAKEGGKILSDSLRLFINQSEIEKLNRKMDLNFLRLAAEKTGGGYYSIENYAGLGDNLAKLEHQRPLKQKKSFEIRFAENEIILIILIILFVLEWIFRKFYRLL